MSAKNPYAEISAQPATVDAAAVADAVAALTGQLEAIANRLAGIESVLTAWSSETGVMKDGVITGSRVSGLSVTLDGDYRR